MFDDYIFWALVVRKLVELFFSKNDLISERRLNKFEIMNSMVIAQKIFKYHKSKN